MKYVIIGNGAAGNAASRMILDRDPAGQVIILSQESHAFYYRPLIPNIIDGSLDKGFLFRDKDGDGTGVERRLGQRVVAVDPEGKRVILEAGEEISYDRLLIATGGSAHRPPLPGMEAGGVHVLRTLADAEAVRGEVRGRKKALVIGAGRVGVKTASVLRRVGLDVTVVEGLDHVLPLQFDPTAAGLVAAALEVQGIRLFLGKKAGVIHVTEGRAAGVELEDGRLLEGDVTVIATGVVPNTYLAASAGLTMNRGVLVDHRMTTSNPDIYAAGDVVEMPDLVAGEPFVSGLWTNAVEMGMIAGRNMAGEHVEYAGPFNVLNALEVAGIATVSVGLTNPASDGGFEILSTQRGDTYRKLVLKEGVLVGALMVGDIEGAGVLTGLIRRKIGIGDRAEDLLAARPSYAPWLSRDGQPTP